MLSELIADPDIAETDEKAREEAFEYALEVLAQQRENFNAQGYVPKDFIKLLKKAGLYRVSTPAQFGGEPMPPAAFMKKVERISEICPATGWVASFGSALTYFASLPVETQKELYSKGPDVVFAGGLFPPHKPELVEGGYICTGEWQFASGCKGADILGIGLLGGEETKGRPITALVDPADVEIIEAWDVAGMKATGSHIVKAENLFVPFEHTFVRGMEPNIDEPLTRYPALGYAAQVLAVTALGAARGALDFVKQEGSKKSSITGGQAKGNRPVFKLGIGQAESDLRSARAFFYEVTGQVWEKIERGEKPSQEEAALIRLAASQAAKVGRAVVMQCYDLVGTGAIFHLHPLQHFIQDAQVPRQHAMLQENTIEAAGAILLGFEPEIPSFP